MRSFLFLSILLPVFASAQINRSAREFASEQVQEYIVKKLFKDQPYKPGSFGELKTRKQNDSEIAWTIEHKFEITETHKGSDNKEAASKSYKFLFYLDDKMRVLRADSFFPY
jgi:GH35 family endo-1,4-beta-xylanase